MIRAEHMREDSEGKQGATDHLSDFLAIEMYYLFMYARMHLCQTKNNFI